MSMSPFASQAASRRLPVSSAVSSHSLPLEPAETLQPAKVLEAFHHPHGLSLSLGTESFLPRPLLP